MNSSANNERERQNLRDAIRSVKGEISAAQTMLRVAEDAVYAARNAHDRSSAERQVKERSTKLHNLKNSLSGYEGNLRRLGG